MNITHENSKEASKKIVKIINELEFTDKLKKMSKQEIIDMARLMKKELDSRKK